MISIQQTVQQLYIYILYSLLSFGLYFTTSDIPNNQRIFKIHFKKTINKWHVRCLLHSCSHPLQAPETSGQLLLSDGHAYKLLPKEAIQHNPSGIPRVKQWYLLMATRNPVNSPVEVKVVYPIIYRVLYSKDFFGGNQFIKHWTWTVHLSSNKIIRILWSCFETPLTCHFPPGKQGVWR